MTRRRGVRRLRRGWRRWPVRAQRGSGGRGERSDSGSDCGRQARCRCRIGLNCATGAAAISFSLTPVTSPVLHCSHGEDAALRIARHHFDRGLRSSAARAHAISPAVAARPGCGLRRRVAMQAASANAAATSATWREETHEMSRHNASPRSMGLYRRPRARQSILFSGRKRPRPFRCAARAGLLPASALGFLQLFQQRRLAFCRQARAQLLLLRRRALVVPGERVPHSGFKIAKAQALRHSPRRAHQRSAGVFACRAATRSESLRFRATCSFEKRRVRPDECRVGVGEPFAGFEHSPMVTAPGGLHRL